MAISSLFRSKYLNFNKKTGTLLVLLPLSTLALAKTPVTGKVKDRLKVGVILPMSGSQKDYGIEALTGIELAQEEVRKTEPDLAQSIEMILVDDQSTPAGAARACDELLKGRVSLVMGSALPPNTASILLAAEKQKAMVLSPSFWGNKPLVDTLFSSNYEESWEAHLLAKFAMDKGLGKNAGVLLTQNDASASDFAQAFESTFVKAGGQIAAKEVYPAQADNQPLLERIKVLAQAKIDFLLLPSTLEKELQISVEEAKKAGFKKPILGTTRLATKSIRYKAAGLADVYVILPFESSLQVGDKTFAFSQSFKNRHQRDPSALAMQFYDGWMSAAFAYRQASSPEKNDLKRAFSKLKEVPGLLGPFAINAKHAADKPAVVYKIAKGALSFDRLATP